MNYPHRNSILLSIEGMSRPSWRLSVWLLDLAVRVEPDTNNRWWPESWAALIPAQLGCWVQDYWHWRHVKRHLRAQNSSG